MFMAMDIDMDIKIDIDMGYGHILYMDMEQTRMATDANTEPLNLKNASKFR
jgi:hypothetical protein